jgi:hypothetical protein
MPWGREGGALADGLLVGMDLIGAAINKKSYSLVSALIINS